MEMTGSLLSNLDMAVTSAHRLRDKPIYPDTMKHWEAVLRIARAKLQHTTLPDRTAVAFLADRLEEEIKRRGTTPH